MYKHLLLLVTIFSFSNHSIAQDSGISFEVHYPLVSSSRNNPVGASYVEDATLDNSGILGGTLQYQFTDNIPFNFGFEYKFDLFQYTNNPSQYTEATKSSFLISNLNVFSKMLFLSLPELQIYTTGGFTVYKYKQSASGRSYLGFNVGGGLSYDIFEKIYTFTSYSFLKATLRQNDGQKFGTDTHQLIRIGLGFKL